METTHPEVAWWVVVATYASPLTLEDTAATHPEYTNRHSLDYFKTKDGFPTINKSGRLLLITNVNKKQDEIDYAKLTKFKLKLAAMSTIKKPMLPEPDDLIKSLKSTRYQDCLQMVVIGEP
jgi:hypothetical protein